MPRSLSKMETEDYSEKRTPYVVSSQDKPEIHHIYAVDTDLGSIFFNDAVPHGVEEVL